MRRYPAYRDSGVAWLGEVPEGWRVLPLKAASRIVGGTTPSTADARCWDGDIIWATPADLTGLPSRIISQSARTITLYGCHAAGLEVVPKGSIVLSTRAPIGSIAVAEGPLCTNQGCKAVVPHDRLASDFVYFLLLSAKEQLNALGRGSTFVELSGDQLGSFRIPLPPLTEQQAIAAFLDQETAKIDALVAQQRRLIELLREKRQAVITHAVTRGLDPTAPLKPSGVEWLGDVPEGWEVVQLRHLADCLDSFRVPLNAVERSERQGSTPYWGANGIVDFVDRPLLDETLVLLGEDGAPFLESGRDVAFVSTGPIWPNNHVHVLRTSQRVLPGYMAAALNATDYAAYIEGSTRDKLTQSSMNAITIAVPPMDEQHQIVAHLENADGRSAALSTAAHSAIALLQERRAALISAAVTGRIDVRDSVPAPEAA